MDIQEPIEISYIVENGLGQSKQTFQSLFQRRIPCQKAQKKLY